MSAVVVTSPTPRRVRAPKWLDFRLVAGVVLVLGLGTPRRQGDQQCERLRQRVGGFA